MMTLYFSGADGEIRENETLTSGMVRKEIRMIFSEEWDGFGKTAVFTAGGVTKDVVVDRELVTIPAEVLDKPAAALYIGVYGVDADGRVIPTVRMKGPEIEPGADPSGDAASDPSPSLWAQIQSQLEMKVDSRRVSQLIGTALTQAKESGSFDGRDGIDGKDGMDGRDGYTPVKGVDYFDGRDGIDGKDGADGRDGYTPVKGVDYFDGQDGKDGQPGRDGVSGKDGADGKDGYTPVRGADYWTDADQEQIVQQVITALGMPVFGRVDEENNIILTGALAEGTYTLKYEDAEGNLTQIGTLDNVEIPEIVNMITRAVNTDGTEFVGPNGEDGYKTGYRLNSSGTETAAAGIGVTGYIPVKFGDVVYFKNIAYALGIVDGESNYLAVYDSAFKLIASVKSTTLTDANYYLFKPINTDPTTGQISSLRLADGSRDYGYLRMSSRLLNADSVITVNQEIP